MGLCVRGEFVCVCVCVCMCVCVCVCVCVQISRSKEKLCHRALLFSKVCLCTVGSSPPPEFSNIFLSFAALLYLDFHTINVISPITFWSLN